MKEQFENLQSYFHPIIGEKPWRARLGFGSFLTFDFGPKTKKHGHMYGAWHLWVYQCEWKLLSKHRCIANAENDRELIERAVRRLESYPFSGLEFDVETFTTTFRFGREIRLVCSPYESYESIKYRELWMFFLPDQNVVSVSPGTAIMIERADSSSQMRAR